MNKTSTKSFKAMLKASVLFSASVLSTHLLLASSTNEQVLNSAYDKFIAGNSVSCYQDLQAVDHLLGNVNYDTLLGLCAQAMGEHDVALLAYNRILSQQENNAEARLERARVLYALNLYAEARREFEWLQKRNPPKAANTTINQYLSSIKKKSKKVSSYTRLKISTRLGQDSNVNSATELDEFIGFTLNDNSKATSSSYYGIGISAEKNIKLTERSGLRISTSLSNKSFQDAKFADQDLLVAGVNYKTLTQTGAVDFDVLTYRQKIDSKYNGRGFLFTAAYKADLNKSTGIKPYLKASALRYADNIESKNVNKYALGARLTHIPSLSQRNLFSVDFSFGHDFPIYVNSNYEADFTVLSLAHSYKWTPKLSSFTNFQYKKYAYDQAFFVSSFPDDRSDDIYTATTSLNWNLSKNLSLNPRLSYRDASSNVDLFTYERWFAEIAANYQWTW